MVVSEVCFRPYKHRILSGGLPGALVGIFWGMGEALFLGRSQYHVATDGRFLMLKGASDQGQGDEPQVILVLNFFEE